MKQNSTKPKLLIVAGAGSSLMLGMPSVKWIDSHCLQWAQPDFSLAKKPEENLYRFINETLKLDRTCNTISEPNFEDVFGICSAFGMTVKNKAKFTHDFSSFVKELSFPPVSHIKNEGEENGIFALADFEQEDIEKLKSGLDLKKYPKILPLNSQPSDWKEVSFSQDEVSGIKKELDTLADDTLKNLIDKLAEKKVDGGVIHKLASLLIGKLLACIRYKCKEESEKIDNKEFEKFKDFFKSLSEKFEIAIVNLNYDNLIYRAFSTIYTGGIETGFDLEDEGKFKPKKLMERRKNGDWSCLLHIHGSVHFDYMEYGHYAWKENLSLSFNPIPPPPVAGPHGWMWQFPIITGGTKIQQLQWFPFRTYYSEMERLVSESEALLFLGYGFNDDHINLAFQKYHDFGRRRVVIIDYPKDKVADNQPSLYEKVRKIFNFPFLGMDESKYFHNTDIESLKNNKEFSQSRIGTPPLSLWWSGMEEACEHPKKITTELEIK